MNLSAASSLNRIIIAQNCSAVMTVFDLDTPHLNSGSRSEFSGATKPNSSWSQTQLTRPIVALVEQVAGVRIFSSVHRVVPSFSGHHPGGVRRRLRLPAGKSWEEVLVAHWLVLLLRWLERVLRALDADAARHPSTSPNRLTNAPHRFFVAE